MSTMNPRGTDMIVFHLINTRAGRSFGFLPGEPQRFFLIALDEAAGRPW